MRWICLALLMITPAHALDRPMDHHAMMMGHAPTEAGQSAFAAIQEIVARLEADPRTDWSKVDIEALRQHLIDMDNVTLHAEAKSEAIPGGVRFSVSGAGPTRESIQRMILGHAEAMNGVDGWSLKAVATEAGAELTVLTPPRDVAKVRALGFIGVMTRGMHHQMHHWMIARGEHPH